MDGVRDAINRGDILSTKDIADWDAPSLYCPADYEELVRTCDSPVDTNSLLLRADVQLCGSSDTAYASVDFVQHAGCWRVHDRSLLYVQHHRWMQSLGRNQWSSSAEGRRGKAALFVLSYC